MFTIGITGGSGAGKTTLLDALKERGALVIDCDEVYHELLRTDADMLRQIDTAFPGTVKNGELDRKALGNIVFDNDKALFKLNDITHKCVDREIRKIISEGEKHGIKVTAIDAIALIESGIADRCDVLVAITAPKEVRAQRLVKREGISYEYAMMRIEAQKPDSYFVQNCNYVLENATEDFEAFRNKCDEFLKHIIGGKDTVSIYEEMESEVRSYSRSFPTVFSKAKMSKMYDEAGKEYIDFFAGAGALNYGHNNDYIKERIIRYLESDGIIHSLDMFATAKTEFLETLRDRILRPRNLDYKVMFCGPTGTNAVEAAQKLCRKVKDRENIFAFMGAFHGMTLGSLAMTSNRDSRIGAGTNLPNVTFIPFPGMFPGLDTIAYLENILTDDHSGIAKPAAIFIECVQADGGINVAPTEFLRGLRNLCDRFDILLVCDDIQVGCGRTGPFFSFERAGIVPDAVTLSKSISGYGLPMSILLFRQEMDIWKPGEHNGTFRGMQLSFVGAKAALEYRDEVNLQGETERKGEIMSKYIEENILPLHPALEHRGIGLAHGVDFSKVPVENMSRLVSAECFKNGLIIERVGRGDNTLKLMPPLVITDDEMLQGMEILVNAIKTVLKENV